MSYLFDLATPEQTGGRYTILVVEDEIMIRMALSDYLQECGFDVIEASTADEAVTVLEDAELQVDVILSDIRMPGSMDGLGLSQWVREHRPGVPILLTTGDAGVSNAVHELCQENEILRKPYNLEVAQARVRALVDGAN